MNSYSKVALFSRLNITLHMLDLLNDALNYRSTVACSSTSSSFRSLVDS